MVINNFDIFWSFCSPPEANPELIIDPDTPLTLAISAQFLEPISGRNSQIVQVLREIELHKLSQGLPFDLRPPADLA
jgi:hypothetical protein